MRFTQRPQNVCKSCGYVWYPRGHNVSLRCPRCGSTDVGISPVGCIVSVVFVCLIFFAGLLMCNPCSGPHTSSPRSANFPTSSPASSENTPSKGATPHLGKKVETRRACDLWGHNPEGRPAIIGKVPVGVQAEGLRHAKGRTEVRLPDGQQGWLNNACLGKTRK